MERRSTHEPTLHFSLLVLPAFSSFISIASKKRIHRRETSTSTAFTGVQRGMVAYFISEFFPFLHLVFLVEFRMENWEEGLKLEQIGLAEARCIGMANLS
ncbi:hypothetical protein BGZ60DRAFT_215038 [Tricladium varicosporioides]|nr:hypothetical protein BGZ60DRAFT_215038 [Hymenoscyphus varicosporioides]